MILWLPIRAGSNISKGPLSRLAPAVGYHLAPQEDRNRDVVYLEPAHATTVIMPLFPVAAGKIPQRAEDMFKLF